eukprot:s1943_g9.t1
MKQLARQGKHFLPRLGPGRWRLPTPRESTAERAQLEESRGIETIETSKKRDPRYRYEDGINFYGQCLENSGYVGVLIGDSNQKVTMRLNDPNLAVIGTHIRLPPPGWEVRPRGPRGPELTSRHWGCSKSNLEDAWATHINLSRNKDVVAGVHNLSDAESSDMFYAAAHTGVIFDYNTGVQRLLQGHVNPISATAVSKDKKWIVTADTGPDSMMVVWERESGTPVKTFFNPHPYGVHALDIAPKLQYLVTLAAPTPSSDPNASQPEMSSREGKSVQKDGEHGETADYQSISVWDWPSDHDGPICTAAVGTNDVQTCVLFNAWDTHEIATNGKRRVFFWTWDVEQPFQFYSPALTPRDFKQRIGDYTQTIFLPDSTQAATGTIDGDVVIWDLSLIVDGLSRPDERRAVKIIKLCPDISLNVLQVHEKARVVIGTADGAVRFYDYQFRVQAWFEDLLAGSVKSISFERHGEEDDFDPGISSVGVEDGANAKLGW